MVIINSYPLAVTLLFITMLCWGSWANTQKLASKEWPSQLYYWDYTIGVLLFALISGLTLGSMGEGGRSFLEDLRQASSDSLISAFIGGIIFNLSNLLIVAAIDIAGMAVAFPIAVGLALVLGVIVTYVANPTGNPTILFLGVGLVAVAIVLSAVAYRRIPTSKGNVSFKGIAISILSGVIMGFFYRFVADAMTLNFQSPEVGKLTPYSAVFVFSIGIFISNFLWNSYFMYKPIQGTAVSYREYFSKGNLKLHLIGVLGGLIWNLGMSLSLIAAEQAGPAISYGLGQGATLVAVAWGVFIWKEFKQAKEGTGKLLALVFLFFILGLSCIILAR